MKRRDCKWFNFETYVFGAGSQIMLLCSLRFMTAAVEPGGAKAAKWQDNYCKGRSWRSLVSFQCEI